MYVYNLQVMVIAIAICGLLNSKTNLAFNYAMQAAV